MSLRRINLNLLPVLDALLRYRNVTHAGEEIGLSQSATSHALTKLREHFEDELLVKSGREMKLTHRAKALAASLEGALGSIERLLDNNSFDPGSALRNFRIGTADYVGVLILPELMRQIQPTPGLTVHVDWADHNVEMKLGTGELDLAILPRGRIGVDLNSMHLFDDHFVLVAAADNDEVYEGITREAFTSMPYASFLREESDFRSLVDMQFYFNDVVLRRRLVVSEFLLLPYLISTTSYVTTLPRRLADLMTATMPLKIVPLPFATEPIKIDAYWSRLAHSDVGHQWLRERLLACKDQILAAETP